MVKKFRAFAIMSDGKNYTVSVENTYKEALAGLDYHRLAGFECYIQEVLEED